MTSGCVNLKVIDFDISKSFEMPVTGYYPLQNLVLLVAFGNICNTPPTRAAGNTIKDLMITAHLGKGLPCNPSEE
jgi:hypothetical protein